jgi:hypothetical protein
MQQGLPRVPGRNACNVPCAIPHCCRLVCTYGTNVQAPNFSHHAVYQMHSIVYSERVQMVSHSYSTKFQNRIFAAMSAWEAQSGHTPADWNIITGCCALRYSYIMRSSKQIKTLSTLTVIHYICSQSSTCSTRLNTGV